MFRLLFISALLFFLGYGIFSFLLRYFGVNKNRQSRQQYNNSPKEDSKHFKKDIGEYVPYEEVKEDEK